MSQQDQLMEAIQAQNELLQRLLEVQQRQADSLARLAQQFDQVTSGGNAMFTEVAA